MATTSSDRDAVTTGAVRGDQPDRGTPVPRLRSGARKAMKRSDVARARRLRAQRARAERKAKLWKRAAAPLT